MNEKKHMNEKTGERKERQRAKKMNDKTYERKKHMNETNR